MPLSFASFVPDSPLLITEINSTPSSEILRLVKSFSILADYIKTKNISTIIMFSAGAETYPGKLSIIHDPVINGDLNVFSRADISLTLPHNTNLAYLIAQAVEHTDHPVKLVSQQIIDYTFLVPLLQIREVVQGLKIIPIVLQESQTGCFELAKKIRKIVDSSTENILLMASGEICRAVGKGPASNHLSAIQETFANKVLANLKNNNLEAIVNINEKELKKMNANSLIALQTLITCINQTKTNIVINANETNLGVNYLNVIFNL